MEPMNPAGPRAMHWETPLIVSWMHAGPARVCTAPLATMMMPEMNAIGRRM